MIFRAKQFDQCRLGRYAQDASLLGLDKFPDAFLLMNAPKEGQSRVLNLKHIQQKDGLHYAEYEETKKNSTNGHITAVIFID